MVIVAILLTDSESNIIGISVIINCKEVMLCSATIKMGSIVDLSQVLKKQASLRLREKLKSVRLLLTDVTEAQLLTEEATNNDPWGPETRTMALISQAAFEVDDYWRIVEVLHKRLSAFDKKRWRVSFKTLVLLEYLLTHGPKSVADEFRCEKGFLQQLENFQYVDDRGVDSGLCIRRKVVKILELFNNEELLIEERNRCRKISREIRLGSFSSKDSSSGSFGSGSSRSSSSVTFGSLNPSWNETEGKTGIATEKEVSTTYENHKSYGDDHAVLSTSLSLSPEFSPNTSLSDQFFSAEQLSDTCTSISDAMNSLQTEKCSVGHYSNHEWNLLQESNMSNWGPFERTVGNQKQYDEKQHKNSYAENISPLKIDTYKGFCPWSPISQTGTLLNSTKDESNNSPKARVYSKKIYPFHDVDKEITECLLSKTPK